MGAALDGEREGELELGAMPTSFIYIDICLISDRHKLRGTKQICQLIQFHPLLRSESHKKQRQAHRVNYFMHFTSSGKIVEPSPPK